MRRAYGRWTMCALVVSSGCSVDDSSVFLASRGGGVFVAPKAGGSVTAIGSGHSSPTDIAVDATHVYWTDQGNNTVRKAPKAGGMQRTLASGGGANSPRGIALDATHVYWVTETEPQSAVHKVPK